MITISDTLPCFRVQSGIIIDEGDIAELTVENNEVVLTRSQGACPLGMVVALFSEEEGAVAQIEFRRCIGSTDKYETSEIYPVKASLFVSPNGKLTTKRYSLNHPEVAMVLAPPSVSIGEILTFLWL